MSRTKIPPVSVNLSLEENALDSLVHGVEHLLSGQPRDLKYTVLHLFHAVELYLKARLARTHPILIREKPEQQGGDFKTVTYEVLIGRLKNVGVVFSKSDLDDLDALRRTRNSIEHYRFVADRNEISGYVGRTMKFLQAFLQEEMGVVLSDILDPAIYGPLAEELYSYEERLQAAKERISEFLPNYADGDSGSVEYCEVCGEFMVLVPDPTREDGTSQCFFCGEVWYSWECSRCGCITLASGPPDDDETVCANCWGQMMED